MPTKRSEMNMSEYGIHDSFCLRNNCKVITEHILLIQVLNKSRLGEASHYYIPESSSLIG